MGIPPFFFSFRFPGFSKNCLKTQKEQPYEKLLSVNPLIQKSDDTIIKHLKLQVNSSGNAMWFHFGSNFVPFYLQPIISLNCSLLPVQKR